jgi:hypothetical protein
MDRQKDEFLRDAAGSTFHYRLIHAGSAIAATRTARRAA